MKKQTNKKVKNAPVGVKIISIYIILMLILNFFMKYKNTDFLNSSIIIIAFAILIGVSISVTLWNGYKKARIIVLIFSALGIINNIFNYFLFKEPLYLISIVLLIPIVWHLGFNKEAKEYFKK